MQVLVSFSTALRFVFWIIVIAALAGGMLLGRSQDGVGGTGGGAEVEVRAEAAEH
ncbi:hypothetical protein [Actinophytocola xanthii]|uniref:hypothetical protein n=1 Tax=Actinophytocola xanthii TaxID=1912961 RepID=UPI001300CF6E|nr:hypothetical protein [Actinophytocola xanthii]